MNMQTVSFCVTSKSGLGHLRRVTNVATSLRKKHGQADITLHSNARPTALVPDEWSCYSQINVVGRDNMAMKLAEGSGPVVIDTAVLPGIEDVQRPLCLILRQTRDHRLERFKLPNSRPWDLLLLPNPKNHWIPDPHLVPAKRVQAIGWIYRQNHEEPPEKTLTQVIPRVLIASGGGGSGPAWANFRVSIAEILREVRLHVACDVSQVIGPRADESASIPGVDRVLQVGGELHRHFRAYDLVITAAGYNSVLELACSDVPTLLIPIEAKTYDDQLERSRHWAEKLGAMHHASRIDVTVDWMLDILRHGYRRAPVALGESGAAEAARLIWGLEH